MPLRHNRVVLFTGYIVMILMLMGILVASVIFVLKRSNFEESEDDSTNRNYQYVRYDMKSNEANFGFADLPKNLDDDDFIMYKDGEGVYSVISPFSQDKYTCKVSCSCYVDQSKRKSYFEGPFGQMVETVFYTVYALSIMLAVDIVTAMVVMECDPTIGTNQCQNVESNVEFCEKVPISDTGGEVSLMHDNEEESEPTPPKKKGDELIRKFFCNAKCRKAEFLVGRDLIEKSENYKCDTLTFSSEIVVEVPNYLTTIEFFEDVAMSNAKKQFAEDLLHPFCQSQSLVETTLGEKESVCIGVSLMDFQYDDVVDCVKTYVPPSSPFLFVNPDAGDKNEEEKE